MAPPSGSLAGHGGAGPVYCWQSLLFQYIARMEKPVIEAAAGRPSGRRPFIADGGMGVSTPINKICRWFWIYY
jgi:hypothetical protein